METCKICNSQFKRLTDSHLKTHNISYSEYIKKYNKKCCIFEDGNYHWKCFIKVHKNNDSDYCILHEKTHIKNQELFFKTLESFITTQENNQSDIIYLGGIHFPTDFYIKRRTFKKRVIFTNSVFYGKLIISDLHFFNGGNFRFCVFNGETNIRAVTFHTWTRFTDCKFCADVTFLNVIFHGVSFASSIFEKVGNIRHCNFYVNTSFRYIKTPNLTSLILFYFNQFQSGKQTWFENLDMSKISFKECDLSLIKFINVNWVKPKWPATRRKCLIDEFKNCHGGKLSAKYFSHVKTEYQQLKMNFEESRDYSEAGDFYYGEMECRRKSNRFFRFLPSLNTIYWISSGYGERPIRAGINLLILVIIWCLCLMLIGIKPNEGNIGINKINYELKIDLKQHENFLKDFLNTITYIQEILLREEKPNRIFSPIIKEGSCLNGNLINNVGFILVYLQVLLFALSIRRRYRR